MNDPRLKAYRALHDGLSDMIEGGRLTEAEIPDDYQWLVKALTKCVSLDQTKPVSKRKPKPIIDRCDDCKAPTKDGMSCPDGAFICHRCFDAGHH